LLTYLGLVPSGERLRRKGRHDVLAGKTVIHVVVTDRHTHKPTQVKHIPSLLRG